MGWSGFWSVLERAPHWKFAGENVFGGIFNVASDEAPVACVAEVVNSKSSPFGSSGGEVRALLAGSDVEGFCLHGSLHSVSETLPVTARSVRVLPELRSAELRTLHPAGERTVDAYRLTADGASIVSQCLGGFFVGRLDAGLPRFFFWGHASLHLVLLGQFP